MTTFFIALAIVTVLGGLLGYLFLSKTFGAFGVAWGAWAGFCLTVVVGVIIVIAHFASANW